MRAFILAFIIVFGAVGRAESYHPLEHMKTGTEDMFTSDNVPLVLWGSVATVTSLLLFDHSVDDYFSFKNRLGGSEKIGNNFLGTGAVGASIALITLAHGYFGKSEHSMNAAEAHFEALIANLGYTSLLKITIPHERPDAGDHYSFPSGHTSTMFTTTAVLMDFYGPAIGYPMMAFAAFTGIARVSSRRHHLSDVIFGATLGYWIGHAYSQHHLRILGDKKTALSVMPFYGDQGEMGLAGTWLF